MEAGGAPSSGNMRKGKGVKGQMSALRESRSWPLRFWAIGLVGGGETATTHLVGVGGYGFADAGGEVVVALHEPWGTVEHSEHIVDYQDLAIAIDRGADADNRNVDRLRDIGGDLLHHTFNDDRERAGFSDGLGISADLRRFAFALAASTIAA